MNSDEKPNASIVRTLCLVAPIVALTVAATWALLRATESSEFNSIASQVSAKAALGASEMEELTDLRTKVLELQNAARDQKEAYEQQLADAKSEADRLATQLSAAEVKIRELSDPLASAPSAPMSVEVPAGEARFIIDKSVAVGVEAISDSFATVRIGNYSSADMYPGESRDVQLGDRNFVVTLMRIEARGCVFAVRKA